MIKEYSAGAVIYRKNSEGKLEYLIVQSIINKNWGFPKGHIEGSETPQSAAKREVFEEVGLKPEFNFDFVQTAEYKLTENKSKEVTYFLAKYVAGQEVRTQPEEIIAHKWVTAQEAEQYLTVHRKLDILLAAQDFIEK